MVDEFGSERIPSESERPSIHPADVFEVKENERRRRTLRFLRNADGTVTLGALAEHVAAGDDDATETAISSDERKRVSVRTRRSRDVPPTRLGATVQPAATGG